jgi:hypothetical protein
MVNDAISAGRFFAGAGATIIFNGVAVIAFLDPFSGKAIPACGDFARQETDIRIILVAVITLFHAFLNIPVPTESVAAVAQTGIRTIPVPVIAFFPILFDTVSASGKLTIVGASVIGDTVPIITIFAWLNDTVSARRQRTLIGATIIVNGVSIITLLRCLVDFFITTDRGLASAASVEKNEQKCDNRDFDDSSHDITSELNSVFILSRSIPGQGIYTEPPVNRGWREFVLSPMTNNHTHR